MRQKSKLQFSKISYENRQNLIILSALVLYSVWLGYAIFKGPIQTGFSGDYLAFWSAGKVADLKGYSEVYRLESLKSVQLQELDKLGLSARINTLTYSPLPVALFPFFIFPFQLLSRISIQTSYWIWAITNLLILLGYLYNFTKKISPDIPDNMPLIKLILLMLVSYPVWMNFVEGQVEVLIVLCTGESIRQAINHRPFLSGFWLAGLLIKPQLLILIMPIYIFLRYWKAISGFALSSVIVLGSSLIVAGFAGIKAMFDLWTKFSAGMATNSPEMMINWRMIGLNLNAITGASFGWVIAGMGIFLTLGFVYYLVRLKPVYGSSVWVFTMAVVFSATLAITWHSHYHMAVVLIPFLIFITQSKLFPSKIIFAWAATTPCLFLIFFIISLFVLLIAKTTIPGLDYLVATSGFCLNFVFLVLSVRHVYAQQNSLKVPIAGDQII